jgi:hypothetical protein
MNFNPAESLLDTLEALEADYCPDYDPRLCTVRP